MRPEIDQSHDPRLRSWVPGADEHPDFPVQNLPYGLFDPGDGLPRPGVAIGNQVLDLAAIAWLLPDEARAVTREKSLAPLFALPPAARLALRHRLSALLAGDDARGAVEPALRPAESVAMHLPMAVGDYTDFYAGIHHATNVGRQFRPDSPLLPNYKWVPIGYHGRASSVRPSGTPVVRPHGQRKPADTEVPDHGPARRLDYELELGVWIGTGNRLGEPVPVGSAERHVAGLCLLNDWSARDLQAWEYQPLGPFLAKSFLTSVSPWVVTMEALAPFRTAQPPRPEGDPRPLPYLWNDADQAAGALSLTLEVHLRTAAMRAAGLPPHRLARTSARNLYWTIGQMVAHHSSNGCALNPGDLFGTGTISAPDPTGYGSLLELTEGGAAPVALPCGGTRAFLEDGDEVTLTATAEAAGFRPIGFGSCTGRVMPALG